MSSGRRIYRYAKGEMRKKRKDEGKLAAEGTIY
jgi:hypothetical protein